MPPFVRQPFAGLPAKPRRAHPYFAVAARDVTVESAPFGRVRIHVREHGAGEPLLLIHGLMTSSYSWRYVMGELGTRYRVIAPDLPGAGRSDKPDRRYGAAELAMFIGELQTALGVRGCRAVGNSLGGYLCMRHALADPGAYARLVNIHSPAFPIGRLRALHAALSIPGAKALLRHWITRAPLKWAHANVHYYDESLKSLEEAHEYGDPLATPDGVRAFVRYLAEALAPRELAAFAAELGRRRAFPVPLLLLYSRRDPLVPPAMGERLHALLPDAKLVWLDETSHFAHVDTPDRILPPLLEFLT